MGCGYFRIRKSGKRVDMSKINLEQMQAASRRRYGVDSRRQRLAEKLAAKERRERRRAGLLGRAEMDIMASILAADLIAEDRVKAAIGQTPVLSPVQPQKEANKPKPLSNPALPLKPENNNQTVGRPPAVYNNSTPYGIASELHNQK